MKSLNQKVVILTVLILANVSFAGTYSGGNGSEAQPYQIGNPGDWQELMTTSDDWSSSFILTADVNLAGITLTPVGNSDTPFYGVFDGNHNKISNVVINQPGSNNVGLFGYVGGGQIRNLGVENINMTGSYYVGGLVGINFGTISNCYSTGTVSGSIDVGGLVGYSGNSISNCYSTGAVTGGDYSEYVGGLVGYSNYGSISDCNSTGSVSGGSGSYFVGGLVGWNYNGSISNCYSTGAVTGGDGSEYLGGLVGFNYNGSISNCYSTCTVTGGSYSYCLGGLVGFSDGTISNCYSTGVVTGGDSSYDLGGFVGWNYGNISNCYSTGNVTGGNNSSELGGLVGSNGATISDCYSTGMVSGSSDVGGLAGYNDGTISSSYFLITSGPDNGNGTSLTDEQMKQQSSFAGWDFSFRWDIVEGQTYPFFKSGEGTGTPDDPYKIATKTDLLAMAADASYYNECFILTADINMEGQVFMTAIIASDNSFTGTFDGNGHKITDFTINGGDDVGLFGQIGFGGSVKNLGLENFSVSGSDDVGGLVGYSDGSISNCYSTGSVSGGSNSQEVGGLVGDNEATVNNCYSTSTVTGGDGSAFLGGLVGDNYGSINNSYSTGTVTGGDNSYYLGGLSGGGAYFISNSYSTGNVTGGDNSEWLGGLVGDNEATVNNCYSTSTVTGGYNSVFLGGLVGVNGGNISNCYSTGTVTGGNSSSCLGGLVGDNLGTGTVSNCYSTGAVIGGDGSAYIGGLVGYSYDGTTSSSYFLITSGPDNGNGTPLTDEQMKQQSSFADWDFNDIWHICETTNYPKLIWQIVPGDFVCPDGVDFADYSFFAERWLNTNCASNNNCDGADLDLSGTVDIADLAIMCDYWLKGF